LTLLSPTFQATSPRSPTLQSLSFSGPTWRASPRNYNPILPRHRHHL
jgi:hypothetical protein